MSTATNRQIAERFWAAFARRDWKGVARLLAPDAHYTDVGVDPVGAHGPAEIIARLSALDGPVRYAHRHVHTVAEGDIVITEHVELFCFASGEEFEHPFVSVLEMHGGLVRRYHDYSHAPNLFNQSPPEWLEQARNWRSRIVPLDQRWPGEGF